MSRIALLTLLVGCAPSPLVGLNEVGSSWLEIYNQDARVASIGAWSIQLDLRTPWTLPDSVEVQPGDVRVVDGFDLAAGVLKLRDESGELVQEIDLPELESGQSYARLPDGDGRWRVIDAPTPGELNGE